METSEKALARLRAAGVASHGLTVDAGAGLAEREVLGAILGAVQGQVFRLAPFRYAIDLGDAGEAALGDALGALGGAGAARLAPIPAPPEAETPEVRRAVMMLGAMAGAVGAGAREEGPEARAVIDAEFALAAARLVAEGLPAPAEAPPDPALGRIEAALGEIAARLAALEAGAMPDRAATAELSQVLSRLEAIEARLGAPAPETAGLEARLAGIEERLDRIEARSAERPDALASLVRLGAAFQGLLRRLDGEVEALGAARARLGAEEAERLGEIAARLAALEAAPAPSCMAEPAAARLGAAIAETLGRLERQSAAPGNPALGKPG